VSRLQIFSTRNLIIFLENSRRPHEKLLIVAMGNVVGKAGFYTARKQSIFYRIILMYSNIFLVHGKS
jgi:hypothetical protein